jgi:nicotinate-nucleotide--dimethylbenzimidazole phosphoribosyltransferase
MTEAQAVQALETGIEIVNNEIKKGLDIVGTGDMGIGNTTASSAIFAAMTGLPPEKVTGRGTGLTDEQLVHKTDCIRRALDKNKPDKSNPVGVLAKVGGFEIGGLAGVIWALRRIGCRRLYLRGGAPSYGTGARLKPSSPPMSRRSGTPLC